MTGDEQAAEALPRAARLAVAVDEHDLPVIREVLESLDRTQLIALAVVLAAHVDLEKPLTLRLDDPTDDGDGRVCLPILCSVADRYDVAPDDILSASRVRRVIEARHVAMTAATYAGLSLSAVGRWFDRDHTTVLAARRRVQADERLDRIAAETWTDTVTAQAIA